VTGVTLGLRVRWRPATRCLAASPADGKDRGGMWFAGAAVRMPLWVKDGAPPYLGAISLGGRKPPGRAALDGGCCA